MILLGLDTLKSENLLVNNVTDIFPNVQMIQIFPKRTENKQNRLVQFLKFVFINSNVSFKYTKRIMPNVSITSFHYRRNKFITDK